MKYPVEKTKKELRQEWLEELGYRIGVITLGGTLFSLVAVLAFMFLDEIFRTI
jgi:hypothetical protein